VIERAYKKLALDALVIQQGRLAEQKSKGLMPVTAVYKAFFCNSNGLFLSYMSSIQLSTRMTSCKW
jgi:hypothetical protein